MPEQPYFIVYFCDLRVSDFGIYICRNLVAIIVSIIPKIILRQ